MLRRGGSRSDSSLREPEKDDLDGKAVLRERRIEGSGGELNEVRLVVEVVSALLDDRARLVAESRDSRFGGTRFSLSCATPGVSRIVSSGLGSVGGAGKAGAGDTPPSE